MMSGRAIGDRRWVVSGAELGSTSVSYTVPSNPEWVIFDQARARRRGRSTSGGGAREAPRLFRSVMDYSEQLPPPEGREALAETPSAIVPSGPTCSEYMPLTFEQT